MSESLAILGLVNASQYLLAEQEQYRTTRGLSLECTIGAYLQSQSVLRNISTPRCLMLKKSSSLDEAPFPSVCNLVSEVNPTAQSLVTNTSTLSGRPTTNQGQEPSHTPKVNFKLQPSPQFHPMMPHSTMPLPIIPGSLKLEHLVLAASAHPVSSS